MSKMFYHVMQDNAGNLLFDVSGTMRIAGSGTLATIYGDEALTAILPNPMTNHPSFGSFKCFLGVGDYDFYMAKSGYTFETLTGVQGSGSMADQNANAVAITGGSATGLTTLSSAYATVGQVVCDWRVPAAGQALYVDNPPAGNAIGLYGLIADGANRYNIYCPGTAPNYLQGVLGVRAVPLANVGIYLGLEAGVYGLVTFATNQPNAIPLEFRNQALVAVGSIATSATATAYNTSSDTRLKHAITPLTGALNVVRALNPISHLWRVDDSPGVGFLADEVAEVVGGVVTGDKDAIDEDGQILPQQMDYSKLVPWLVSAVKELTQQVEMLTAKLTEASA